MTSRKTLHWFAAGIAFCLCDAAHAQSQTRFNYQAQIRDAGDAVLPNAPVDLRVSIRMGTYTGADVYREVHSDTTSSIGLVNILVGAGMVEVGDIDAIAWGDTAYYLKIDADFGGGYADMGGAPITSVPIAEYAKNGGRPWSYNPNGIHYNEGNVGIGTDSPTAPLEVRSLVSVTGDTLDSERIRLSTIESTRDVHVGVYDELGVRHWNLNLLDRSQDDALSFYSDEAGLHALRIDPDGGIEVRATTHSKIRLYAEPNHDSYISAYNGSGNQKWIINMGTSDPGTNEAFAIYSNEANGGNGQYLMYLRPDGRTQVRCLEILGGCDINERFNSTQTLEPGTVVIADPDRPGEVRMTDKAYDARVVGAISGANGIKPGLTLTQEGSSLDGTHPIALDGRVYVNVTGPVEVGDLLTTSAEPGKAMAVKNRKRAFGAVIGKALESDADGDGLVLMLVQPR